jgi:hypothetical protein
LGRAPLARPDNKLRGGDTRRSSPCREDVKDLPAELLLVETRLHVLNVAVGVSSAFGDAVEENVQRIEVAAVADLHEIETGYNQILCANIRSSTRRPRPSQQLDAVLVLFERPLVPSRAATTGATLTTIALGSTAKALGNFWVKTAANGCRWNRLLTD